MRRILAFLLATTASAAAAQDTLTVRPDSAAAIEAVQVIGVRPTKSEPFTLTQIKVDSTRPFTNGGDPFFTMSRWSPAVLAQSRPAGAARPTRDRRQTYSSGRWPTATG